MSIIVRYDRAKWEFHKKIRQMLLTNRAIIFGGAVRDYIIRAHHAKQFHDHPDSSMLEYSNPEHLPEHRARLLLPEDIDCFMTTGDFDNFMKILGRSKYAGKKSKQSWARNYLPHAPDTMRHTVLTVMMNIPSELSELPQASIKLDVFHDNVRHDPPFGAVDFECNGLVMHLDNQASLSKAFTRNAFTDINVNLQKLCAIQRDILHKKAVSVGDDLEEFRIRMLVNRGWKVVGDRVTLERATQDDVDESRQCIVCTSAYAAGEHIISLDCCRGPHTRMHRGCALKMMQCGYNKCTICRKSLHFSTTDMVLIDAHFGTNADA